MAGELEGGCRVFGLREGEPKRHGDLDVWRHVGRELGAKAISLSTLELPPGGSAAWRNSSCAEALFVVSGEGAIILGGERGRLDSLTGAFARPGELVSIECYGKEPLTLLESRCPDPGAEIQLEAASSVFAGGAAQRSPSPIIRFEDQPEQRAGDGRWFRVLVDAEAGCGDVTQFVGFIPPGRAPDHYHEYEEVVCILEGEGHFWSGASSTPVKAGTCLYLPRRQPHCLENTGESPLSLYGLFYPAGSPSVRFHPGGLAPPS